MKKIFTLATIVGLAYAANAQEIWKAADYDLSNATLETLTSGIYGAGNADAPDTSVPGELKTSTITVKLNGLTLTGESTPNSDNTPTSAAGAWQLKGNANEELTVDGCNPKFTQFLMGQGNPEALHWEFDEETDNGTAHRVYGTYWQPGDNMPAKGNYWKFDVTADGTLKVAIYGNKNGNPTYIVDADTKQPLPYSDIDVAVFYQNTGFAYDTDKYLNVGKMPEDYVIQHTNGVTQNRPVMGYLTFSVAADKTYYLFNTKSQVGLYGFEFTPSATGALDSIIADGDDADAPTYNIYGHRVGPDYKGLVIRNGKKYIQK